MDDGRQPMVIPDEVFELPTQPSSIVLGIANLHALIGHITQDDHDCDRDISEDESEDPGESTL